jgi:RNA polymerase sigma-70 factor (ECF subfamily)
MLSNEIFDKQQVYRLVTAAQAGERDAFGELFQRFQRHVFATAMRYLPHEGDAQELCQEVFVQALEKITQLRDPSCFGGWLRSITHRMAINRLVRRAPVVGFEADAVEGRCVETRTPLGDALDRERSDQVHAGLRQLRPLDRETLEAFYLRGQTLREMSIDFDAPIGTIKRRLHTARRRLREVTELVAV